MKFVFINIVLFSIAVSAVGYEGTVFPASSDIIFSQSYIGDTAVIEINNYSSSPITNFVISDFSIEPAVLIDCEIDGQINNSIAFEYVNNDVYAARVSSRWMIDYAQSSIIIRYYTQTGVPYYFNWHGKIDSPVFGIIETCCRERGDINHSGGIAPIDITDVNSLVNYIFNNTFVLPCMEESNVNDIISNTNLPVNISDLTYLVDYIFRGGAGPVLCR
ncbi:MAG: hypothetical protein DRP35_03775 [Candidatus Zixiibacteriota bacterium]|nr:MAG: hypothetical protein DRP35_03775 [candidate division Zixibacteria bacterium]